MKVPPVLLNSATQTQGEERAQAWAAALDHIVFELFDRWKLTDDPQPGSPWAGAESLVIPVRLHDGFPAVLRIAAPNTDNPTVHEQTIRALRAWGGHGAVRIIEDDPSMRATLQERLRTEVNLSTEPLHAVAPIWGQLVQALRVPGGSGFVRVQDIAAAWLKRFDADVRLVEDFPAFTQTDQQVLSTALSWTKELAGAADSWLLHADLHYYNILAGNPDANGIATWKAIDPQPLTGPTEYMLAPLMWNRLGEIPGTDPEGQADWLRGFAAELSRCAQINPSGAMGASVAREVQNMFWYLRAAADGNPRLTEDAERSLWVARALTGVSVQGIATQQLKPLG